MTPTGSSGDLPTDVPTQAPAELPPTSEELISAALDAGTIDYEHSLLYRALALYDSPGLPEDFRSPVPDMHAAFDLMGEIDDHESELSADVLAQLAPYRVRPADPTSIFNNPPARAATNAVLAVATVQAWVSKPAASGVARVWVKPSASADAQLTQHAAEVSKVWSAIRAFFTYPEPDQPDLPDHSRNPDSAIDFYFVDAADLDPRVAACVANPALPDCVFGAANDGYAQRAEKRHGTSSSAYLVIGAAGSGLDLLDTLAHELTHAGQFAYDAHETSWLYESTATWVAYRVIKSFGESPEYAYRYVPGFFATLDQKLTRTANKNAYAAWQYYLFASMEEGDAVVETIWEAAAAEGKQGERAVDSVFSFDQHFPDFAMRNWNREPAERLYKTYDDTFPRNVQPKLRNTVEKLPAGAEQKLDVALPPLASAYFSYVPDTSARTITFDNTLVGVPGAHVWAMRNINNAWQRPEDWTDIDHKEFCRDIPDEDLWQLVIVVSNADLAANLKATESPRVAATAEGCSGWRGTMTGTYDWHNQDATGTGTTTFTGIWRLAHPDQLVVSCRGVPPSPGDCLPYLPDGTIKWHWDAHENYSGCEEHREGSWPAGAANDPRNAGGGEGVPLSTQVLVLVAEGTDQYRYWAASAWGVPDRMKCGNPAQGVYDPPGYIDLPQGSTAGNGGDNTCQFTDWLIDAAATSITGSCYAWNNEGSSLMYEWNLQKVGDAIPAH